MNYSTYFGNWLCAVLLGFSLGASAQMTVISGTAEQERNQGIVKNVNITAYEIETGRAITNTLTNNDGYFKMSLVRGKTYRLVAEKEAYFYQEKKIETKSEQDSVRFIMERKPGYTFDVSLSAAGTGSGTAKVHSIIGARIEIYNNTKRREELSLDKHPIASFKFNFEEGNHYTIMVRKKGYLTKRIEAYINIKGCILCFEGMGMVRPNVVDVMADGNQLGSFLSNLEMEPVAINKKFVIENLYYDYDKSNIRPDAAKVLDNLLIVLKDNPALQLEMGSHTDARGSDAYNMSLSERRARSAVEYIVARGVSSSLLTWKGYGETQLTNHCANGVQCSDEVHERNRRTELKVVGILDEDPLDKKTLKQIIESESPKADTPFYGDSIMK